MKKDGDAEWRKSGLKCDACYFSNLNDLRLSKQDKHVDQAPNSLTLSEHFFSKGKWTI